MQGRRPFTFVLTLAATSIFAGCAVTDSQKSDFSRSTIDIGIVVSDIEKSAKFYKEAIGFTEIPGFDVSADMGADTGLTDNKAFHVRRFVLIDEPTATNIKLMQFPDAPGGKIDNRFIHTSLGLSYLTIVVSDINAALQRAAEAGVVPAKKTYKLSGGDSYLVLVRDPDGNLIELIGPMKD